MIGLWTALSFMLNHKQGKFTHIHRIGKNNSFHFANITSVWHNMAIAYNYAADPTIYKNAFNVEYGNRG